jgi:hypothetical protein
MILSNEGFIVVNMVLGNLIKKIKYNISLTFIYFNIVFSRNLRRQ